MTNLAITSEGSTMPDNARFWNRMADGYAKKPVADQEAYEYKLERTRAYLTPHSRVMEFGCGTGTTALLHATAVASIEAIDISKRMIEIAEAKAAVDGTANVAFFVGAIEDYEAQVASYDVIMAHSILHLLGDKEAVITKVLSLLKPGGVFVSSTACLGGSMPWLRLLLPIGHTLGLLPKVQFFTKEALQKSLQGTGFEIKEVWQPSPKQGVFIAARKPALAHQFPCG